MSSGGERKFFDLGPAGVYTAAVYTGGTTGWGSGVASAGDTGYSNGWITSISQGAGGQQRIGNAVTLESLFYRINVIPDTSETAGHISRLRFLLVSDQECDGAAPSYVEVLGDQAGTTSVATGEIMCPLQPAYFGRFRVLEDKIWTWTAGVAFNTYTAHDNFLTHERFHDMKNHMVRWDPNNGNAIANARRGHIFSYLFYENTVSAAGTVTVNTTNPPAVQVFYRLRFVDAVDTP